MSTHSPPCPVNAHYLGLVISNAGTMAGNTDKHGDAT